MTSVPAADIPVAHTPPGGYGAAFPAPVLSRCTEALVEGAPDLRGMWKTVAVDVQGTPAPAEHKAYGHLERIEQCGMPGGEVTRRRDGDEMVWSYVGFTARLRRIGPPGGASPRRRNR